jgi:hypothetical protein
MLPSVTHVFGERNFIFQDDNCRVHRAFLNKQGVRTVPWPSYIVNLFSFSFLTFFFCCFITF